uniref:Uncharacterized protein n=1 Tax=viral metagenome TaxID=1070528 RepID=A0A6M3Y0I8_9ZZZZ
MIDMPSQQERREAWTRFLLFGLETQRNAKRKVGEGLEGPIGVGAQIADRALAEWDRRFGNESDPCPHGKRAKEGNIPGYAFCEKCKDEIAKP